MFPTVYRGTVFGIANLSARVGGLLAPLVPDLVGKTWFMFVFGVLGIMSCAGSLVLKETKGTKLNDVMEQSMIME